ncbi:MAG: hypothetical protein E6L00_03660 [Thaumarchaeota archaeon]|nr:MAG: hypothetical protein E6L02_02385 [Nitrososphaerota archaeon]TLX82491.1 MAG: hypothetical protein E6L00_03660 [Nitrososphaerota archaeon]
MDYPVVAEPEGVKLKPELMEIEKLYYCIFQDKIMLFFKDQNELLNCYEIEDKEIVETVKKSSSTEDIENILQKFIDKENVNH